MKKGCIFAKEKPKDMECKKLNLKKLRVLSGLKSKELAKELFPNHKAPYRALYNAETGHTKLDSDQLQRLANLIGVPVGMLFEGTGWDMAIHKDEPKIITFTCYDYVAKYDRLNHTTCISTPMGVLIEKEAHCVAMGLSEYVNFLTELIIKNQSKNEHN